MKLSPVARQRLQVLSRPLWHALAFRGRKTYSAMVRVRNEEEFLYPSVASIAEMMDQIVIVDNRSDDRTPEIIRQLERDFPGKIDSYRYDHQIARPGEENAQLASTKEGARSPRLLANFYNWCLAKCRESFILKWDGDTVALPSFLRALDDFRTAPEQTMSIGGVNVHPHLKNALTTYQPPEDGAAWYVRVGRSRQLQAYEDYEPRLFPRRLARYTNREVVCEALWSPYKFEPFVMTYQPMAYLHFKHCKRDLYSNISPEMKPADDARWVPGDPLDDEMLACVSRWQITAPLASEEHPTVPARVTGSAAR